MNGKSRFVGTKSMCVVKRYLKGSVFLGSVIAGCLCCGNVCAADVLQKSVAMQVTDLLRVHDTLNRLPALQRAHRTLAQDKQNYDLSKQRFDAMTQCNINRLKEQFKEPAAVWQKMTDTYDKREKNLAIYINSGASVDVNELETKTDLSHFSDREVTEAMAYWSLGNDILTDVYANQDKWGARANPGAPSFPLWQDQKFFFDKDWNAYYESLNAYYGVPLNGRPAIDDRRYDYNQAQATKAAHDAYLATLAARSPAKTAMLPEKFKKGPKVAPRPLPPAQEHVMFLGNVAQTHQVFPAWPEPWQRQIENNFANYNVKGEMAKNFKNKSFELKDSVQIQEPGAQNNRLNVYQDLKKKVDSSAKLVEAQQTVVKSANTNMQDSLKKVGIDMSIDQDLTDPSTYQSVKKVLQDKEAELIALLEKNQENLEKDYTATLVVQALKKDKEGTVKITRNNALHIDQLLLEDRAQKALYKEIEQTVQENTQKPIKIDESCLNGGI